MGSGLTRKPRWRNDLCRSDDAALGAAPRAGMWLTTPRQELEVLQGLGARRAPPPVRAMGADFGNAIDGGYPSVDERASWSSIP